MADVIIQGNTQLLIANDTISITPRVGSGGAKNVNVKVLSAYEGRDARIFNLNVNYANGQIPITLTQDGADPFISIDDDNIASDGGAEQLIYIKGKANAETITIAKIGTCDWADIIELKAGSKTNNQSAAPELQDSLNVDLRQTSDGALSSYEWKAIIKLHKNASLEERGLGFQILGKNVTPQPITVTQGKGDPELSVSSSDVHVGADKDSTAAFTITSNCSWTIK